MFQNFTAAREPVRGADRLNALRGELERHDCDAFIVPHRDAQNNEYLPAEAERLAWISGFTGSAGSAIITQNRAALLTDGRYTLQAGQQTDPDHWGVVLNTETDLPAWVSSHIESGTVIGIDPWLHGAREFAKLESAAKKAGATIKPLTQNPLDAVWHDQPAPPAGAVHIHDFKLAGRTTRNKLEELEATMATNGADGCLISDPTSVSWLFNIRGTDVAHTPLVLAHALLRAGHEPLLFIDEAKLDIEVRAFLTQVADLRAPETLDAELATFSDGRTVMLDPDSASVALTTIVEGGGGTVIAARDPVILPRAIKNEAEIKGSRRAHIQDGIAMCAFLHWLDGQSHGSVDEIEAAARLENFRREQGEASGLELRDISFDTISGSGPHGAIVHYRVDETTNRTLQTGELYLVDSGGQYDCGTTDITRTVAIGAPPADAVRAFTLVLKGHIAIAMARFPIGTRGVDIDGLARIALWQAGMDYGHGTGHGIGSYLSVHEGPQNISKRGMEPFKPGMIVSNEPGYYREGEFGIRIENLVLVHNADHVSGGDQPMLGFETLTFAPIDLRLVDVDLLTGAETAWLNSYHARVFDELSSGVSSDVRGWLREATRPV
ncbi:aminopeptidase P family protein [Ahrensia sp. R2A130]|uniref:aminopeptidase P family protein n=1 Tax=Ahrensia sp. R2A130 TaxID=744979 RepID=UPI0001E0C9BC|nr:aminopeptidase P family protein [Ahrensia sp. R2A130]EFL90829.1 Xaa-Pro aminopeptidase 1 [Ahrensia sp. R2A130]